MMSFEPVLTLSDMPSQEPLETIRFIGGTNPAVVEPKTEPKKYMHWMDVMVRDATTADQDEVTKLRELAGTFVFLRFIVAKWQSIAERLYTRALETENTTKSL